MKKEDKPTKISLSEVFHTLFSTHTGCCVYGKEWNWEKPAKWKWKLLSCVRLLVIPWTIQSMEFSRPEYWSGLPFPSPGHLPNPGTKLRSPSLQVDSLPAKPPGKPKNTGVGSLSLLQRTFPTRRKYYNLWLEWAILSIEFWGLPYFLNPGIRWVPDLLQDVLDIARPRKSPDILEPHWSLLLL